MSRVLAALVTFIVLAGCTSAAPNDDGAPDRLRGKSPDCIAESIASCYVGGNETSPLDEIKGAGCEVFGVTFLTTRQVFDPYYPAGVEGFHDTLESVYLVLTRCAEIVYGPHVRADWEMFWLASLIDPPSGGDDAAITNYVHQGYTNDETYAFYARKHFGLDLSVSTDLEVTVSPLPVRGSQIKISVPGTEPAYEIIGTIDIQDSGPDDVHEAYVFETGSALAQFSIKYSGTSNTAGPATVTYNAGSYWANHSSVPQTYGTTVHDFDLAWNQGFSFL